MYIYYVLCTKSVGSNFSLTPALVHSTYVHVHSTSYEAHVTKMSLYEDEVRCCVRTSYKYVVQQHLVTRGYTYETRPNPKNFVGLNLKIFPLSRAWIRSRPLLYFVLCSTMYRYVYSVIPP